VSRPDWPEYFLNVAKEVAKRSTCLRVPAGVGAVLVANKQILATGYAGSIRLAPHCTEVGCMIDEKTGGCVATVHAEINAILQAAQHGVALRGATLYCTMSPCWDCMKALLNGGIEAIYYSTEYRIVERQKDIASKLGIPFVHVGTDKYTGVKS
jgi:dCMP deaminase